MNYLGIDPGANGGLCLMDESFNIQTLKRMPMIKSEFNLNELRYFFTHNNIAHCFIEKVHSIFGASAKSNFRFGFNCGVMEGYLGALGIPYTYVSPKEWQKTAHINIEKSLSAKEKSLVSVQRKFPSTNFKISEKGKPHDGLVDAALIVEHGVKFYVKNKRTM